MTKQTVLIRNNNGLSYYKEFKEDSKVTLEVNPLPKQDDADILQISSTEMTSPVLFGDFANITEISFTNIGLTPADLKKLFAKSQKLENLTKLNLQGNQLSSQSFQYLKECIEDECFPKLEELDLSNNILCGPEGAKEAADIINIVKGLKYINLKGNNIGNEGAKAILPRLKDNNHLVELVLKDNNIKNDVTLRFAEDLNSNKSLLGMDLSESDNVNSNKLTANTQKMITHSLNRNEMKAFDRDAYDYGYTNRHMFAALAGAVTFATTKGLLDSRETIPEEFSWFISVAAAVGAVTTAEFGDTGRSVRDGFARFYNHSTGLAKVITPLISAASAAPFAYAVVNEWEKGDDKDTNKLLEGGIWSAILVCATVATAYKNCTIGKSEDKNSEKPGGAPSTSLEDSAALLNTENLGHDIP